MKLKSIRIRNYRSITEELTINFDRYLSIVGPNNSGKTNILKAIQVFFNPYEYYADNDFPLNIRNKDKKEKTTINVTFSFEDIPIDDEIAEMCESLAICYEDVRLPENEITAYLTFTNDNPTYQFFPNAKKIKQLQSQISYKTKQLITKIIESFSIHYIPSHKSIEELFEDITPLIENKIAEAIQPYQQNIIDVLDNTSESITSKLHEVGLINISARFAIPFNRIENIITGLEFRLKDTHETLYDQKGLGIQTAALFSTILWVTEEEKRKGLNTIWLLEEPESYLHPQLANFHKRLIQKLRGLALVVNTTHSVNFIPGDPKCVIGTEILSNGTQIQSFKTYADSTKTLRKALGVEFSDFFHLGKYNVLVEGPTDREYIKNILSMIPILLNENDYSWNILRSDETEILDFGGVKFLSGFLRFSFEYISKERSIAALFDGDDAGRKEINDLNGYFGNKQIPFRSNLDYIQLSKEEVIENLFPKSWIDELYLEHEKWFRLFVKDVNNNISHFKIEDDKKSNAKSWFFLKIEKQENFEWANQWITLFNQLNAALENKKKILESLTEDR